MTCSPGALSYMWSKDGTGAQTQLATDIDDYISEDFGKIEAYIGGDFIRGTRSQDITQVRQETIGVGGTVQVPLSYYAIEKWAKRILGGGSANAWEVAETLQAFELGFRKGAPYTSGVPDTNYEYANCKVASATISGTRGSPVVIDLNIVGTTESTNTSAALTVSYTAAYQPFILNDLSVDISSTLYAIRGFSLTIDNAIETDYTNSITATDNCPQDRIVTLSLDGKQGDLYALYSVDFSSGVAVDLELINAAGYQINFLMGKFVAQKETANVPGRGTMMLPIQGQCFADKINTNKEITITSVTAP